MSYHDIGLVHTPAYSSILIIMVKKDRGNLYQTMTFYKSVEYDVYDYLI